MGSTAQKICANVSMVSNCLSMEWMACLHLVCSHTRQRLFGEGPHARRHRYDSRRSGPSSSCKCNSVDTIETLTNLWGGEFPEMQIQITRELKPKLTDMKSGVSSHIS